MQETWVQSLGWEDPLEEPMDRGAWQAIVHGVAKSQTELNDGVCIHAPIHSLAVTTLKR